LHPLALGAGAANFCPAHRDADVAIGRDLFLQLLVELAFHFAHFSALQASNMDMVARPVALVEVPVPAQVQQIEFVDQAVALQQIDRTVDRDARDVGINLLRAIEDFARVEMPPRSFHHLQQHAALPGEPDSARAKLALQAPGRFVDVDAFAGRNSMCWSG